MNYRVKQKLTYAKGKIKKRVYTLVKLWNRTKNTNAENRPVPVSSTNRPIITHSNRSPFEKSITRKHRKHVEYVRVLMTKIEYVINRCKLYCFDSKEIQHQHTNVK